jgi:hypothetical protein
VPNPIVYPRPWYRDAAMMLMCFAITGNLALVEPWVMGLSYVHDFNNSGEAEADNPGQVLYMLSLFQARSHPIVPKVLKAIERFRTGDQIQGRTDYNLHPVFQTKWLKFGLRALGMEDPFRIPAVPDSYDRLFWMDYRDQHVPGPRFSPADAANYPYLHWAEAHFLNAPPPGSIDLAANRPLSWETAASNAEYWRLDTLFPGLANTRTAAPHSWHAAEMFLYLHDPHMPI